MSYKIKPDDKILFLDYDGVVNGLSNRNEKDYLEHLDTEYERNEFIHDYFFDFNDKLSCMTAFDNLCISKLNEIVKRTNCKIVISSSWGMKIGLTNNMILLALAGFKYPLNVIGNLEYNIKLKLGESIEKYIEDNNIHKFIIIDDEERDFKERFNEHEFYRVKDGLLDEDVERISEVLNSVN